MKQQITIEQLNELTPLQKEKLENWVFQNIIKTTEKFIPLFSIGQMIWFLEQDNNLKGFHKGLDDWLVVIHRDGGDFIADELCDALWKAVIEVLKG